MRKLSYIIVFSLITVFITGHYFIYKTVLNSHKKEFKAYINANYAKIEKIEILTNELYANSSKITWMDNNQELCINGMMYDILSITKMNSGYVLNVVKDKEEKELMYRYQNQFNELYNNGDTGKNNTNLIKDFLSLKYFQNSCLQIKTIAKSYSYFDFLITKISNGYLIVPSPPPLS